MSNINIYYLNTHFFIIIKVNLENAIINKIIYKQ